ncbi:hypothetical protein TGRH88_004950 [Toxoplasma gondii]|uniref:Uncharacterized protein n=1 Tax=Toxoplasma gondii TaxID=5811 RepID=A0A7J6KFU9_TOXGO|nr:hypothetical protein TGRH88_004950 [Toxoplasma gondii]
MCPKHLNGQLSHKGETACRKIRKKWKIAARQPTLLHVLFWGDPSPCRGGGFTTSRRNQPSKRYTGSSHEKSVTCRRASVSRPFSPGTRDRGEAVFEFERGTLQFASP